MADNGGIASLLKALNDTPTLGAGLSKTQGISSARAASGLSSVAKTGAPAASTQARRTLATTAPAKMPKILSPEGSGFDPKAPRGTYLNLVV